MGGAEFGQARFLERLYMLKSFFSYVCVGGGSLRSKVQSVPVSPARHGSVRLS